MQSQQVQTQSVVAPQLTKKEKMMIVALKKLQKKERMRSFEQKKKTIAIAKHKRFTNTVADAEKDEKNYINEVMFEEVKSKINMEKAWRMWDDDVCNGCVICK